MSTVGTSPTLGGLVDLDVLDDEVAGVETLGVGVGLSVLEEVKEELGGLDGPAGLGDTERLACRQSYCQQCEVPEKLGRITHDSRAFVAKNQNSTNSQVSYSIKIMAVPPLIAASNPSIPSEFPLQSVPQLRP